MHMGRFFGRLDGVVADVEDGGLWGQRSLP